MNILHYSLGLPPFRRGGMTKYCDDLMIEQKKIGNSIFLLFPGTLKNRSNTCSLVCHGSFTLNDTELDQLIEIRNPLPVSLVDGINDVELFTTPKDIKEFDHFFEINKFDVFHIHTLMGLPFEVVYSAKAHNVKVIFTSHDYFPICPRVFLFHDGNNCEFDDNCKDCINCNSNALSFRKMKVLQSRVYQFLKDTYIVKRLRELHNKRMYLTFCDSNKTEIDDTKPNLCLELASLYSDYRKRNVDLLNSLDKVHFNSTNTWKVYEKYGKTPDNSLVISISSRSIENHKQIISVKDILRIGYLGPAVMHKGIKLLLTACDELWENGIDRFQLHLYTTDLIERNYVFNHGPYEYVDLSKVMTQFDVLIVPSIWNETFGFTILEAHSYGVPAIVSERVGAKDLIIDGKNGLIFQPETGILREIIHRLIKKPEIIEEYSRWIYEHERIKTMQEHAYELIELYENL